MQLWVRSQDREMLMKVFEVRLNWQNDKEIICNSYTSDCCDYDYRCLGTYATKERALEVLDEIQNVLKPITVFKNAEINKETWEEIQKVGVCAINDRADVIKLDTFVYEMPKE